MHRRKPVGLARMRTARLTEAMGSSAKTRERMAQRVDDLILRFSGCLDFFDHHVGFVGPSVYFHNRALAWISTGQKSANDRG
jgi:hypothetical protein